MPQYLAPEQIQELRDNLTMLDVYRARKSGDKTEVGLQAYYNGALRLGLVDKDVTLDGFLERLRTEDFNAILAAEGPRTPLALPLSGGETEPDFSSGTDTPPESS